MQFRKVLTAQVVIGHIIIRQFGWISWLRKGQQDQQKAKWKHSENLFCNENLTFNLEGLYDTEKLMAGAPQPSQFPCRITKGICLQYNT